jgi:hypothetical protein
LGREQYLTVARASCTPHSVRTARANDIDNQPPTVDPPTIHIMAISTLHGPPPRLGIGRSYQKTNIFPTCAEKSPARRASAIRSRTAYSRAHPAMNPEARRHTAPSAGLNIAAISRQH